MPDKIVGSVPDFTSDEGVQEETIEEVKEPVTSVTGEEKDTPAELPAESVETEEKPITTNEVADADTGNLTRQVQGLKDEKEKLLREVMELRGSRRELKQQEIASVDKRIQQATDELKNLHPDDVSAIEHVLKAKGYITKEESSQMYYEATKKEEISKFLEKFPEYKPENDSNDLNWSALERQIKTWYRMPDDPRLIGDLLVKAHRDIAQAPRDRTTVAVKQQQIKVASSGSSGNQRSSPKPANSHLSNLLRTHMQGWSEEEISNLEKKLPE